MKVALAKASLAAILCLAAVVVFYLMFGQWPLSGLILLAIPVLVFFRSTGPGAE
jgi:hypothetical protein